MINIQVANKVLLVFFVKINLAGTITFSISTSPPKNESLVIVKFPFFQFHYCQKLKVLYSFLYMTINCFIYDNKLFYVSLFSVKSAFCIKFMASFLSLRLEGVETLKYRCVCWPPFEKVWYSKKRPWTHAKVRFLRFNR